jgi:two-component system NtrC family sensor kinase
MPTLSGTARRLLLGFGALVLMLGAASTLALTGVNEIHAGMHSVLHHEQGVRVSLALASAVRDQYAHQAHTIILGNDTHLHMYEDARQHVLALTGEVASFAEDDRQRGWVHEIETASRELDEVFKQQIVPAVLAGDVETVRSGHARAQIIVSQIQDLADRLAESFEAAMSRFEEHAGVVQHASFRWVLVLLVGATVFAAGIGLYIGRSVARPVALLEAGARRIAEGDLDARISIDTPDEFGQLASQFNGMTSALKEHQERLIQHEKLAGIGRLAAGIAHEINNPLGVILGYARLMKRKAAGELAEDLGVIEDEAVRCQEIVAGLLELSRPGHGGVDAVDLRDVADEVVERLRDAGQVASVAVTVDGRGVVEGNAQRIRQVVLNVIKNAVEASAPSGHVDVRVEESPESATLTVGDTGTGIGAEDFPRLFEPFFTTKERGTGLGLAVSQAIAQAHGGQLEAANRAGGGACFSLTLPRHARASERGKA